MSTSNDDMKQLAEPAAMEIDGDHSVTNPAHGPALLNAFLERLAAVQLQMQQQQQLQALASQLLPDQSVFDENRMDIEPSAKIADERRRREAMELRDAHARREAYRRGQEQYRQRIDASPVPAHVRQNLTNRLQF